MEYTLGESTFEEFQTLPADTILKAVVQKVEQRETPFNIDDNKPELGKKDEVSFRFQVSEGEHQGRVFFGSTMTYFDASPNCRLRVWVEEILGIDEIPVGFKFDTDDLIDLPVKIVLGVTKSDKNKVVDLVRMNSNAASAAAVPAVEVVGAATAASDEEPF